MDISKIKTGLLVQLVAIAGLLAVIACGSNASGPSASPSTDQLSGKAGAHPGGKSAKHDDDDDDEEDDDDACASNADCDSDEVCTAGVCSDKDGESDDDEADEDGEDDDQCTADDGPDGADDKVTCTVNTDCDPDETCVAGKCTGIDGEDDDEDDSCSDDDEGGTDKIMCMVDADCDPDETCVAGKCTGIDGEEDDD